MITFRSFLLFIVVFHILGGFTMSSIVCLFGRNELAIREIGTIVLPKTKHEFDAESAFLAINVISLVFGCFNVFLITNSWLWTLAKHYTKFP